MSDTKHTPAPWRVDDGGTDCFGIFDSTGQSIAYLGFAEGQGSGRGRDVDEANARLVAAAPDMLDALQYLVRRLQQNRDSITWGIQAAMVDAHAAIAKAEGRAP